jgi:hypothetical protein
VSDTTAEPLSPEWADFMQRVMAAPDLAAIVEIMRQKLDELNGAARGDEGGVMAIQDKHLPWVLEVREALDYVFEFTFAESALLRQWFEEGVSPRGAAVLMGRYWGDK